MEECLYNVGIVGAGPIGGYLANRLGPMGYRIVVLEKKHSPDQYVNCTGIISKECCDLLSISNGPLIYRSADSANIYSPSGKRLHFSRNENIANTVNRPVLNAELARRASLSSVKYIFSANVINAEIIDNSVKISAIINGKKEDVACETIVVASGFGGELTAKLGFRNIRKYIFAAQTEVRLHESNDIEIYLDREVAPGGFAWLVPTHDNHGFVGMLTSKHPKEYLASLVLRLTAKGKIKISDDKYFINPVPLCPLPKTYSERMLVVGEAAGQVKPTTGGGIYFGILCAEIASAIVKQSFEKGDFTSITLSRYQQLWEAKLGREMKFGYFISRLWQMIGNNQIEYLFNVAERLRLVDFVNKTSDFSFDLHGSMLAKILYSLTPFARIGK